jgi:serine protease inhibitor
MPKFSLRWEALLNDPLQALGMRQAFEGGRANFSRMSSTAGDRLYISRVKQKSFVDVHEEGTEAAAVTSVEIRVTCACGPQIIRIDRPFVFAIRERLSGTIIFLGKIVRPPA